MASKERQQQMQLAAKVSAMGIEVALAVVMPTGLGHWADTYFATTPIITLAGFVVGLGAAVLTCLRAAKFFA